jgi:poly(beta-D-mannuronate) lyase
LLGAGALAALAVPLALAGPSQAATTRTFTVSSTSQLASAAGQAQPGDRIVVANGTYSAPVHFTRSGTAAAPITVVAQNPGKALVTTADVFTLDAAAHLVVQGFTFTKDGGLVVPGSAVGTRITRNTFQGTRSGNWVEVMADDTQVDHNAFLNKANVGNYIEVTGPGASDMAKRVHIDHNYFYNHHYRGGNGGESLRVGRSQRQHASAQAVVEDNLFEKANGDLEAISIKSSDNVIRYNTIVNSTGTLTLRHGWGNTVEGNILTGGSTGIRIFGNNHTVINNVVQGTSTSSRTPIEVGGGEIRDDTRSTTDHEAADHCLIAFNTVVAKGGDLITFGSGKRYGPTDDTLANNILVGTATLVHPGRSSNLHWQGNIVNGAAAGAIPTGGYRAVNPQLIRGPGGLYRLTAGSPATGAAAGSYPQVALDIDRQTRTGAKDVGADEYATSTPAHPLTSAEVGPKAP